jgi:LAGLIDADG-like domain
VEKLINIAWVAGVFDGEGCVFVRNAKRTSKRTGVTRVVPALELNLANTSHALVTKYTDTLDVHGIEYRVTLDNSHSGTNRPVYYVKVLRKQHVLTFAKLLIQFATSKRDELAMAIWYLERACTSSHHVTTSQEHEVLRSISNVKHGETIPDQIRRLLS